MKLFRKTHLYISSVKTPIVDVHKQGYFGVYAQTEGMFYDYQLKAINFFLKKRLKGYSKLFVRISLNKFTTKRPTGIRMGKGKGATDIKYYYIKKGQLLYEFHFTTLKEQNVEKLTFLANLIYCINRKSPIILKLSKL